MVSNDTLKEGTDAPAGLRLPTSRRGRKVSLAGDFARVFEINVLKAWDAAHHDDITGRSNMDWGRDGGLQVWRSTLVAESNHRRWADLWEDGREYPRSLPG